MSRAAAAIGLAAAGGALIWAAAQSRSASAAQRASREIDREGLRGLAAAAIARSSDHAAAVRALFRQARRWLVAARQDQHPAVAVLHANYGMAYVLALRQVASDAQIRAAARELTGREVGGDRIEAVAARVQDAAAAMLARTCRGAVLPDPFAAA